MTDTINSGGAAFPGGQFEPNHAGANDREPWNHGMTLRDYFAAKALSKMADFHHGDAFDPLNVAKSAYEYADAMIAARGGEQ